MKNKARRQPPAKTLSKFTTGELEAEIARRHNEGVQWGYLVIDREDDDDNHPLFGIVRVDEWKENGYIGDYCLGNSVKLPDGFYESQEAIYKFTNGDVVHGEELLKKAGFIRLGIGEG